MSIGIGVGNAKPGTDATALLNLADRALYEAKGLVETRPALTYSCVRTQWGGRLVEGRGRAGHYWRLFCRRIADRLYPPVPGSETLPLVAIVGRPNVGKSTLFNRLTQSRRSIVGDEPGITRDRIYGEYEWAGREFRLVDTGGIVPDDPELIPTEIYAQAKVALEEADALVLVVDARTELASPDYDLVRMLIRGGKPLFLAVNKVEGEAMAMAAENFRQLGIRNVFPISSEHGLGIGESAGCHFRGDSCTPECDDQAETGR